MLKEIIEKVQKKDQEIRDLGYMSAVLNWDQEVNMPPEGLEERARMLAYLGTKAHEITTSDEYGALLDEAEALVDELPQLERDRLKELRRDRNKAVKVPASFVEEYSKATSLAQHHWALARKENNFAAFAPHLEKIVQLSKDLAGYLGYEDHPYDALLDQYEPGMTSRKVQSVFEPLEIFLQDTITKLKPNLDKVSDEVLTRNFDAKKQEEFSKILMEHLKYPTSRGRLDASTHPFTTSLGYNDVRITTRYYEDFIQTSMMGTIHEAGHALYELGFAEELKGSALAEGTSLGMHESQSRFWENVLGRSYGFWTALYPKLQDLYPQLADVSQKDFVDALNVVKPSFIRVEADEVTYNLHLILRFRLEMALLDGSLAVTNLPQAWNEMFTKLLGITPPDDAHGVLQDVHWSIGALGYFPTYTIGTLYASQLAVAMEKDLGSLEELASKGDVQPVLDWLRAKVHVHGKRMGAEEIVTAATGEGLNPTHFMKYIQKKYSALYGVEL